MLIKLTNHIRPFSHTPGEMCVLPRSFWTVKAYPTFIHLQSLTSDRKEIMISLHLTGPIKQFTLMQDLERNVVRIFGIAQEGYFAFLIEAVPHALSVLLDRCPKEGVLLSFQGGEKRLQRKEKLLFSLPQDLLRYPKEKICFGFHKKQDWTLVKRRLNLQEILPNWFALGCKYPKELMHFDGTAELLKDCQLAIEQCNRVQIGSLFIKLFQVGFGSMLIPRLVDDEFQGILPNRECQSRSPFVLLSYGADLIRRLFLDYNGKQLFVLPCLPIELHAGRCKGLSVSKAFSVDLEWSKKVIRRLIIHSHIDQTLQLNIQKNIHSFRFEGKLVSRNTLFVFKAGKTYFFDRFEK